MVDTVIPGTRRAKIIEFERPDISGSHIYANRLDRLRLRTGWLHEIWPSSIGTCKCDGNCKCDVQLSQSAPRSSILYVNQRPSRRCPSLKFGADRRCCCGLTAVLTMQSIWLWNSLTTPSNLYCTLSTTLCLKKLHFILFHRVRKSVKSVSVCSCRWCPVAETRWLLLFEYRDSMICVLLSFHRVPILDGQISSSR